MRYIKAPDDNNHKLTLMKFITLIPRKIKWLARHLIKDICLHYKNETAWQLHAV